MADQKMREAFNRLTAQGYQIGFNDFETGWDEALASAQRAGPVGWQFYQDGRWWSGDDRIKDYRKNTEEAGIPTRDVYATPPAAPVVPEGYTPVRTETLLWLLGEGGSFECPRGQYFRGRPTPYFWRKQLRASMLAASQQDAGRVSYPPAEIMDNNAHKQAADKAQGAGS